MSNNNVQSVIKILKKYFSQEITGAKEVFLEQESFKFRPNYGPNKFYLDWVQGSYESSLQNLIHHILWEDGHYENFLNSRQLKEAKEAIEEDPDGIYGTGNNDDLSDAEFEEDEIAQESLDAIYYEVIQHVGSLLEKFEFFNPTDFIDMGYLDNDDGRFDDRLDDDENFEEGEEWEVDTDDLFDDED